MTATRRFLVAVVVFCAVSRLAYLLAYRSDPFASHLIHDARRYHEWAVKLASGQPFEAGAFYQAPLYPYLVAAVYGAIGPRPLAIYALQTLLGVLTVLVVARVARRAYGEPAGVAAAAMTALFGPFVFHEAKLLPAALTVFLAAIFMERMQAADASPSASLWLSAGIALGASALAAPASLLTALLGASWIAADRSRPPRERLGRLAWLAVGIALLVTPVAIRNHRASGDWVLISANGGITFYHGNNPNATGVFSVPPGLSASILEQRDESRRVAEREVGRHLSDGEISRHFFGKGLAFLREDALRSARLVVAKLFFALASDEQPLEYNARLDDNPVRWLFPLPFAVMLALAALRVHARSCRSSTGRAEHPIALLLLSQGITLLAFYVSGRYRLPAIPALAATAGCGAVVLVERCRAGTRSAVTAVASAVLVATLSFGYVPLFRAELRDQQTAMSYLDRSSALAAVGRRDESIEALRRSIALDPVFARRHTILARSLHDAGRFVEAEHAAREALARDQGQAEAHFLLGLIAIENGRVEDAAAAFSEALRCDPTSAAAANNLLGTLWQLGRRSRAIEVWREMRARGLTVDPSLEGTMRAASDELE